MKKLRALKADGLVRESAAAAEETREDEAKESLISRCEDLAAIEFTSLQSLDLAWDSMDDSVINDLNQGLTGLRNLGNTCYMNAALQSLSNCPHLTLYFLTLAKYHASNPKKMMTRSYYKLIMQMWRGSACASVTPSMVSSTLKAINPSFRGHQQQDTQEFLRCFMDCLHEEMKHPIHDSHPMKGAGDAGSGLLTSSHMINQKLSDEAISLTLKSSSSNESPISTSEDDVNKMLSSESRAAMNQYSKELDQLHASGSPLFRSSSLPSISKFVDEDIGEGRVRKRTISSRSPTPRRKEMEDEEDRRELQKSVEYSSVISDIFDGTLRSSVHCRTCLSVSHTRETFQDLSLPIPGKDDTARLHGFSQAPLHLVTTASSSGPCADSEGYGSGLFKVWDWLKSWIWGPEVTLVDCLSAFFSADELKGENMYSCDKCKKLRNGVKYCRLLELPEVLCVHLKRFRHEYLTSYSTKISSSVVFPLQGLDLSQYAAPDCASRQRVYDLSSVIVHQGSAGGGHYISYCKNPRNGNWYEFDDQYVTQVDASAVASAEAYVLFYSKVTSTEVIQGRENVVALQRSADRPALMRFYVSLQWMVKFQTFAEPGPINNDYFVCPHGDVKPDLFADIGDRVCCVTEQVWHVMHERFGGGPSVSHLQPCVTCIQESEILRKRRETECATYNELRNKYGSATNYISMAWFRKWQSFIQSDEDPPDEIDNGPIAASRDGIITLRTDGDYGVITREAWNYLHSKYGGGPVIARQCNQFSDDVEMDVD
ncbi:unnamed protein product [Clavelina lepadiformis]